MYFILEEQSGKNFLITVLINIPSKHRNVKITHLLLRLKLNIYLTREKTKASQHQ